MSGVLAWVPFLDPLDLHDQWWLTIVPLALGISIAYKAVRLKDLSKFWRHVAVMTVQIVGGMILLSAVTFGLVEVVARALG